MTMWCDLTGIKQPLPKNFPKALPLENPCPQLIYGVELEIERVPRWDEMHVPGITSVEDGSLRDNGREFIVQPMTYSNLMYCLENFFKKNELSERNYSDRTSVHIHTNCTNLTMEQIQTICFLYQVFEGILFGWIGNEREENIYCTPWSQTNLSYKTFNVDKPYAEMFKSWQKYTALNLLPLYSYGTIEWRHMAGTNDLKRISTWLKLIGSIYRYALDKSLDDVKKELLELNTNSQYSNMVLNVFKDLAPELTFNNRYESLLEDGVINMKYSLFSKKDKAPNNTDVYGNPAAGLDNLRQYIAAARRRPAPEQRVLNQWAAQPIGFDVHPAFLTDGQEQTVIIDVAVDPEGRNL
jgi:hypothetical protein